MEVHPSHLCSHLSPSHAQTARLSHSLLPSLPALNVAPVPQCGPYAPDAHRNRQHCLLAAIATCPNHRHCHHAGAATRLTRHRRAQALTASVQPISKQRANSASPSPPVVLSHVSAALHSTVGTVSTSPAICTRAVAAPIPYSRISLSASTAVRSKAPTLSNAAMVDASSASAAS